MNDSVILILVFILCGVNSLCLCALRGIIEKLREEIKLLGHCPDCTCPLDERKKAKWLKSLGFKPSVSTGIHGYLTYGYGELDSNGFWQYPLDDGKYVGD